MERSAVPRWAPAGAVESARQQWDEGYRRLQDESRRTAERTSGSSPRSSVVIDELRRRVGQTFTLAELAAAYDDADAVDAETLDRRARRPGCGPLDLVEDAAFHLYARGAVDYGRDRSPAAARRARPRRRVRARLIAARRRCSSSSRSAIALGQALDDNPRRPGRHVRSARSPGTPERRHVTVTTSPASPGMQVQNSAALG